jgi:Anti-sigma factor NepR
MTKEPSQTLRGTGRDRPTSADLLGANSEIGRKLKQYYDELVADDVPDRFADLLRQLEHAQPRILADIPEPETKG